jgi:hypothetical protein
VIAPLETAAKRLMTATQMPFGAAADHRDDVIMSRRYVASVPSRSPGYRTVGFPAIAVMIERLAEFVRRSRLLGCLEPAVTVGDVAGEFTESFDRRDDRGVGPTQRRSARARGTACATQESAHHGVAVIQGTSR